MKNWAGFLLCLLLSGGIWFIHMLSGRYTDLVSVRVMARSNVEGRASVSSSEATVSAECNASGFRLLSLSMARGVREVYFEPSDLEECGGDNLCVRAAVLSKYAGDIFGKDVTAHSVVSGDALFRFQSESFRLVKVKPICDMSFRPQYTAASEMTVTPDSVLVYGDSARLESLENVLTRPVSLNDLRSGVHGKVKLETPVGTRLSEDEVVYSLDVTRFVDVPVTVALQTRNVPDSLALSVFPPEARVVFRCPFPIERNPAEVTEFYIDYADFQKSLTGRCLPRCEGLPTGVMGYTIEPECFDCIER